MRCIRVNAKLLVSAAVLVLCCSGAASCADYYLASSTSINESSTDQLSRATLALGTLQHWYDQSTGTYKTTGWWNSANAITVLVDYMRVRKTSEYDAVLANTLKAAQEQHPEFLNHFYDDEGWWALAWIDAYDLTGRQDYLAMAKTIFADMTGGWDSTCGGGIWWNKSRAYKNAIANELFLSVAAHLANRDAAGQAAYLDWADREWEWFAHSGMINRQNLVNDGLKESSGGSAGNACTNNGKTTWSYNQGVVLGGLAELAKLNHNPSLPRTAQKIATAAIAKLVDANGVMHDPCEAKCGADGVQFKGIFVRNLAALDREDPQAAYKSFITTNAESVWDRSQGPDYQLGQVWSGPFDTGNAGRQSSALDAIVAAASLAAKK